MRIKVIVAGPRGKMGSEAIKMITNEEHIELVGCIDRKNNGKTLREIELATFFELNEARNVPVFENPAECFEKVEADVFLDLTVPDVGFTNTKLAIEHKLRAVVGTSGFSTEQIKTLNTLASTNNVGCIIAPNFAIGAVLMMQFSKMAAKYFPDVEIIEKHHDQKVDAPSGTAVKTMDLIQETRENKQQGHPNEFETVEGARGGEVAGMRVHSMRLPGLVAHQEVIFGGKSQLLTIKHDSFHRESFMEGIKLAIEAVMDEKHLIYGLENILDI
ncbi:4-hydroxy-tetrahydrodipicolinate reductase [Virgibacillus sp. W0430]|uniref:4-hydroxy-tetrahydrodipicolinate reductase n=1 Tax=Virgibacillus sp. W0430 TaxID=3391580 RepID=UPI003F45B9F0